MDAQLCPDILDNDGRPETGVTEWCETPVPSELWVRSKNGNHYVVFLPPVNSPAVFWGGTTDPTVLLWNSKAL